MKGCSIIHLPTSCVLRIVLGSYVSLLNPTRRRCVLRTVVGSYALSTGPTQHPTRRLVGNSKLLAAVEFVSPSLGSNHCHWARITAVGFDWGRTRCRWVVRVVFRLYLLLMGRMCRQ